MDGIIPINKDRGMTSHDVVARMRGILHTKKVGHSGTLDPNVDGVLPICVGRATKVVDYLMEYGKIYTGSITLGYATTTEDLDGEVVETKVIAKPFSVSEIDEALQSLVGEIIQIPPMYSAVKVNGRKLYEYARKGETVERPSRKINVKSFVQTKPAVFDEEKHTQTVFFKVECGKGTYVRTLAVDAGKFLNVPAVMSDLTRQSSGGFNLSDSVTLEQLEKLAEQDEVSTVARPLSYGLRRFPAVTINAEQWELVQHGGFIKIKDEHRPEITIMYDNDIQAIYMLDERYDLYRPKKMLLAR